MLDIEASKVSEITKISRPTINKIFLQIREIISKDCDAHSILGTGQIESYFGARGVKGKRGRGAGGKVPVFGMLKRGDNVYTRTVQYQSYFRL